MKVAIRRVLAEKRAVVAPLAIVFLVNLGVLALFVYPMTLRSRDSHRRASVAEEALLSAQRDHDDAQRTKTRKERAIEELRRFYREVLPPDMAGARRITYLRLAQLAQQNNLKPEHRTSSPEIDRESQLGRLKMTMTLQGDYRSVRNFIHDLETANEFVVIDDVSLTQGSEPSAPLVLTLELSTYYRLGGNAD
jgi:Tfp pilus assembly protein PilO